MSTPIPTRETAVRIVDLLKHGLCRGKGEPMPGHMCVEAMVCYAMGLPHSDNPPCVSLAVRAFKIGLNDSMWSSNMARANGLRRLAIAQLGSDQIDNKAFSEQLIMAMVRTILPPAFRSAALKHPLTFDAEALENAAKGCESLTDFKLVHDVCFAASAVAYNARVTAAKEANVMQLAGNAASFTSHAASYTEDGISASRCIGDAAGDVSRVDNFRSDDVLCQIAEIGVQALIVCNSPGCEWLDLVTDKV